MLGRALVGWLVIAATSGSAWAGWRCVRPRPATPEPPAPPAAIHRPTVAQLRAAVRGKTIRLGGEVEYSLSAYEAADAQVGASCASTLHESGIAVDGAQQAALASCVWWSPAVTAIGSGGTWRAITRSQVPAPLKDLVGVLAPVGKDHLLATAALDSKHGREGDRDSYVLFIAHREETTIVVDAVYATQRVWIK